MEKKDYIFGVRAIIEAMDSGKTLDKVMIKRESGNELMRELLEKAALYNVPVQRVPVEKLNRITLKNHQGAIAIISPVEFYSLDNLLPTLYESGKTPFCVVLDHITDTRNFGAIARTSVCSGADFIVIFDKGSVSVTGDSVKASAGALFHIPVCREKDVKTALRTLQENGYKIVGASEKGAQKYTEIDYSGPVAIVMGAEDTGLSDEALKMCDELAYIPIKNKIESLNVSVAAGIFLYEIVRQREG